MSHSIEQHDGMVAFVAGNSTAGWHNLGTVRDGNLTADEVLDLGHLRHWNVRTVPLYVSRLTNSGFDQYEIPDKYGIVRSNPWTGEDDYLGVAGKVFRPLQNEQTVAFLQALVDESGAIFDTAASLNNGIDTFVTMKMPTHIMVGGADRVDLNIIALNNHNGTKKFRTILSPVRVVCENTVKAALASRESGMYTVKHTEQAQNIIAMAQEARQALHVAFKYIEGFQAEAEKMITTSLTDSQFEQIIMREFGVPEDASKTAKTFADNFTTKLLDIWHEDTTQSDIKGTAWAGYNALTRYYDHESIMRGPREQVSAARFEKTMLGGFDAQKEAAWKLFASV